MIATFGQDMCDALQRMKLVRRSKVHLMVNDRPIAHQSSVLIVKLSFAILGETEQNGIPLAGVTAPLKGTC